MNFFRSKKRITCIIRGVLIAQIFTLAMLTIFSILLVYTNLSEKTIKPVIITITGISLLIGSSIETRKICKNGIVNGGIIGAIYMLSLYLISSCMNSNFEVGLVSAIMIVIGVFGGAIGGILGVNGSK